VGEKNVAIIEVALVREFMAK